MKLTKPLSLIHRSDLLTLSTMTYTSMQGLSIYLDYALEICLVGIKSKEQAIANIYLYTDNIKRREP